MSWCSVFWNKAMEFLAIESLTLAKEPIVGWEDQLEIQYNRIGQYSIMASISLRLGQRGLLDLLDLQGSYEVPA